MTQWAALQKLTGEFQEDVLGLYSQEVLPMEVRQYLALWIESQDWKQAARELSLATVQFQNLLEHLDNQYSRFTQDQEILQQHNFRRFKLAIQNCYQTDPQKLSALIRDLLITEKSILFEAQDKEQSQAGQTAQIPMETARQQDIEQRVEEVKQRVQCIDQEVKFLEDQQETFDFKYKNYQVMANSRRPDSNLQTKKIELQSKLNDLDIKRKEVLDQVKELLVLCETLLVFLQKELDDWLIRQKLSCVGAPTSICLQLLEGWVTRTVEAFFQLYRVLGLLADLPSRISYENDPLKIDPPILKKRLYEMLCCLLKRSFVVDKQPIMSFPCKRPLALKTNFPFSVRARLLINHQKLRDSMKVSYSVDKNPPNIKGFRRFNVLGTNPKCFEDSQGEGLVVDYKHLTLKEQKAGTGGKGSKGANDGSLSVMEELHLISFTTLFDYQGVKLELEAVTLPFVVISNTSQFVSGWASVFWFNLLSPDPKDLNFFSNPPAAPWLLLADALSWQFLCTTKRGLNPDQLTMLGKKLCGMPPRENSTVTWSKFSKENMPRVNFIFWTWFDSIRSLVEKHLENIWNDGYVMGFVSRKKEESLLKTKMTGTFLLRFSESIREGGITCSWVEHQENGTHLIRSVEPYTKKELDSIPLTEIIRNYQLMAEENIPENPLKYLYPDIPKDEAFGPYYEHRSELTLEFEKYLKRKLIIVSDRQLNESQDSSAPDTAQYSEVIPMDINAIIESIDLAQFMMTRDIDPVMPVMPEPAEDFRWST
ncbi:signal transducer and activator of transcription 2 isoform X2 [Ascaphus truei]|uniref:signal transducer and activator of transcription 2 isoform X2 n=1 Tax=Ascaphus truei TaxID=8439 RepID=UPI003F5A46FA